MMTTCDGCGMMVASWNTMTPCPNCGGCLFTTLPLVDCIGKVFEVGSAGDGGVGMFMRDRTPVAAIWDVCEFGDM